MGKSRSIKDKGFKVCVYFFFINIFFVKVNGVVKLNIYGVKKWILFFMVVIANLCDKGCRLEDKWEK